MALRQVIYFPNPNLRTVATPVENIHDKEIQTLIDDMVETMYHNQGIGLAATQIDVHKRIAVIDVSDTRNKIMHLINPEIISTKGKIWHTHGCLSVPKVYDKTERYESVKIRYLDRHGKTHELEADGLLAVCIQHEIDHLNGMLFIDRLSTLKRKRAIESYQKHYGHLK